MATDSTLAAGTATQGGSAADGVPMSQEEADAILGQIMLTDEGRQDPYPAYHRLRSARPRHLSSVGTTVVTRYQDGLELLRSPKWGRPEAGMDLPEGMFRERQADSGRELAMLFLNPPEHTRVRAPFARTFTPRRVDELRAQVRDLLGPILDRVADLGTVDVMSELAFPLPVAVISELIGVPREDSPQFRDLVRDATANIDPAADKAALAAAGAALVVMGEYFVGLIEEKRAHPDDRLLSALIDANRDANDGEGLDDAELLANIILLYAAGFETTSNLIGNGLRAFLHHPNELQRVRDEPGLVGSAVLEVLRWDSPVQVNGRTALEATELFGAPARRGTTTMILQGAGNRDPEVYADPDRFDVARFAAANAAQPLSFGWGAHHCLGAHLARAEGEEVFRALFERFNTIELQAEPHYRPSVTLRGLDALYVELS